MKVQHIIIIALIPLMLTISACQKQEAVSEPEAKTPTETTKTETSGNQNATATDPDVIATVNGSSITADEFQSYVQQKMAANPANAGNPALILNEMINKELLLQAAIAAGVDKRPEVAKLINSSKENIMVNTLINDKVSKIDNSDTALKAEYDELVKSISLQEYKARHILVNDEETAKNIITELNDGKDFETLAKEKSTGPSGPNGGDLGWFQPQTMVPEFATAVQAMEKGSITNEPVKTQFGWHVIKLEDSRTVEPPAFEESKAQIQSILANKTVQTYMTELRDQATINIKEPEKPAAEAPEAVPAPAEDAASAESTTVAPAETPSTTQ